jgi:hypothetical protein
MGVFIQLNPCSSMGQEVHEAAGSSGDIGRHALSFKLLITELLNSIKPECITHTALRIDKCVTLQNSLWIQ